MEVLHTDVNFPYHFRELVMNNNNEEFRKIFSTNYEEEELESSPFDEYEVEDVKNNYEYNVYVKQKIILFKDGCGNLLFLAIVCKNVEAVKIILGWLDSIKNINYDFYSYTSYQYGKTSKSYIIGRLLTDIDYNLKGMYPLEYACEKGYTLIIKELVDFYINNHKKIEPNIKDNFCMYSLKVQKTLLPLMSISV